MPVTTIKRCQVHRDWWYTVEDCNIEVDSEPGSGLAIKYHDDSCPNGKTLLSIPTDDALCIRDAINQLYPPKTQTLKSIALKMMDTIERDQHYLPEITDTLRRALEQLNDD